MPYRNIDNRLWTDAAFLRLDVIGKGIFMSLLSLPQTSSLGVVKLSISAFCEQLNSVNETVTHTVTETVPQTVFDTLSELFENGSIYYSKTGRFFYLKNFLRYNPPANPNVVRSWKQWIDEIPECELKNFVISNTNDHIGTRNQSFKDAWDSIEVIGPENGMPNGLGNGYPNGISNGMPNHEHEHEHEHEEKKTVTKKKLSTENRDRRNVAKGILDFLNLKTSKNYRPVDSNLRLIEARLREGFTKAECHAIIANKYEDWNSDPKMVEYLRPGTLFNATKFAQYAGELPPREETQ